MPRFRELVTQGGADTETRVAIATGITPSDKQVLVVEGIEAWWKDGAAVAAADWSLLAYVATEDANFDFTLASSITACAWGVQNTAGVAVAYPYEPIKVKRLETPRFTAQPYLYVGVYSNGTGQANDVVIHVEYTFRKVSELEALRLLAAGA